MNARTLLAALLLMPVALFARVHIVDQHGNGDFDNIPDAVERASNGDTIKVCPGNYDGAFTIARDIVLMGSGYESTRINSDDNPTISMTSGKIMWFSISSNAGRAFDLSAGQVTNCVIHGCATDGFWLPENAHGIVSNCIITNNGGAGIYSQASGTTSVYNCIAWGNSDHGWWGYHGGTIIVNYCCGSGGFSAGNTGIINENPQFTSISDFHISPDSPCWDSGNPNVFDPDGSRSDMGYFGGPDCPINPVVTELEITPLEGGGVEIHAKGRANY